MIKSEYICGRRANREAFEVAREGGKCFVVTSFTTRDGRRMYADATFIGHRENYYPGSRKDTKGQKRYRVIVTPKQGK